MFTSNTYTLLGEGAGMHPGSMQAGVGGQKRETTRETHEYDTHTLTDKTGNLTFIMKNHFYLCPHFRSARNGVFSLPKKFTERKFTTYHDGK